MVFSQRELEGYIRIDHRESPGIPGMPFRGKGELFEAPTLKCNHFPCQAIVVVNPNRQRARAHCHTCDHYICDACEALKAKGVPCRTFKQALDEYMSALAKGLPNGT